MLYLVQSLRHMRADEAIEPSCALTSAYCRAAETKQENMDAKLASVFVCAMGRLRSWTAAGARS